MDRSELMEKYITAQKTMRGAWKIKQDLYNKPISELTNDELEFLIDVLRKKYAEQQRILG